MGVPELWKLIGDGDIVPIVQLAAEHFERHGRPLRIAVDEPSWRFKNLTEGQVYAIREKSNELAFQGIEKHMFYRICKILTLHIQLLVVFDGPGRPWKRGRPAGKIDYEKLRLIKEVFRALKIPYHEAPGEAEAECARLQQEGIVDAVWSEDSDTLMFGCDFLIRDYRVPKKRGEKGTAPEDTKKSVTYVRVTRGNCLRKHHLDREGLVLFAMLCGGDYDTKGLPGCGPSKALRAVKAGLGTSLCSCQTNRDIQEWQQLFETATRIFLPPEFPSLATLKKYNTPKVSELEKLQNLNGLRHGWERPIDEEKLVELTSTRFNNWTKDYLKWIMPFMLSRLIAQNATAALPDGLDIKVPRRVVKEAETTPLLQRRITFSPFDLTKLPQERFHNGNWTGSMDKPFDPTYRVDCEMPIYLLRKIIPQETLDSAAGDAKTTKKRKEAPAADDTASPGITPQPRAKRSRKTPSEPVAPAPAAVDISSFDAALARVLSYSATSQISDMIPMRSSPYLAAPQMTNTFSAPNSYSTPRNTLVRSTPLSGTPIIILSDSEDDEEDELDFSRLTPIKVSPKKVTTGPRLQEPTPPKVSPKKVSTGPRLQEPTPIKASAKKASTGPRLQEPTPIKVSPKKIGTGPHLQDPRPSPVPEGFRIATHMMTSPLAHRVEIARPTPPPHVPQTTPLKPTVLETSNMSEVERIRLHRLAHFEGHLKPQDSGPPVELVSSTTKATKKKEIEIIDLT